MGKQKEKTQLLKITLTAIWKGETATKTISTRMGLVISISAKKRRIMVEKMKEEYRKAHEASSSHYPGMKLTVKAQVKSWEVDYILN